MTLKLASKKVLLTYLIALITLSFSISAVITANANYGGNTIISGTNANQSQIAIIQNGGKSNITLSNAKKGETINFNLINNDNGIVSVQFTLNTDVSNAVISIEKLTSNNALPGLPITPVALFSISLSNLDYTQITNFSFKFKIKGLLGSTQVYSGYSSNSPWIKANLNEPTPIDSNGDITFTASSPTAFRQYAVTIESTSATTTTGYTKVDPVNTNTVISNILSSDDTLIRTGDDNKSIYLNVLWGVALLGLLYLTLIKSHQKS